MRRSGSIVRYSKSELAALRRKGGSRTNWAKVDATSEAALEASIARDRDDVHATPDWTLAVKGLPPRKQPIKLRIDADVIAWFRASGRGYQTRMNNVLRAFFENRRGPSR